MFIPANGMSKAGAGLLETVLGDRQLKVLRLTPLWRFFYLFG
jgi:hypothetical protein